MVASADAIALSLAVGFSRSRLQVKNHRFNPIGNSHNYVTTRITDIDIYKLNFTVNGSIHHIYIIMTF
jgi:hypothetical protein